MARIDEVRERYESITEQLYKNKETFAEYLKFAGKFYKMPTAQTMTMFATNPKATMVADYDTWKKFGHYVKRGANSIAVLCGNGLKHYFDISQTSGDKQSFALEVEAVASSYYTRLITERESSEYSVEQLAPLYNRFQQDKAFKADVISSLTEQLDETLTSLEVTRSKAAELGIPFSDRPYNSEEEDNPYAYDGSMSIEDSRKVADANNLRDFMLDYSDELELAAVSYNSDEFRKYFADRSAEALRSSYDTQWDEMKDNPEYMRSVCDLVSASLYTDILSEIQQRNIKYPVVYVNGSHNRNFSPEEVGFKLNYPYSVEEFNAALKEANERWNNDDKYVDKLHSVSVSVFASRTESSTYNVELYASYHSIGEIIDMKQSIASANILGKIKAAISEIENKTQDEIPADLDKFYVNAEMENVTWIYYNPDSSAGGQFVYTYMSFDDIFNAMEKDDPLEYLSLIPQRKRQIF